MRSEYDFSGGIKNPYVKPDGATVTIQLDKATIDYFKGLAEQANMPYQALINSCLAECAAKKKKPGLAWNG